MRDILPVAARVIFTVHSSPPPTTPMPRSNCVHASASPDAPPCVAAMMPPARLYLFV
jgi:hypothetical protein